MQTTWALWSGFLPTPPGKNKMAAHHRQQYNRPCGWFPFVRERGCSSLCVLDYLQKKRCLPHLLWSPLWCLCLLQRTIQTRHDPSSPWKQCISRTWLCSTKIALKRVRLKAARPRPYGSHEWAQSTPHIFSMWEVRTDYNREGNRVPLFSMGWSDRWLASGCTQGTICSLQQVIWLLDCACLRE